MRPSSLCSYPCKALAFLQISAGFAWGFSSIQAINCSRRSPSRTSKETITAESISTFAALSFCPNSTIGSIIISLSNLRSVNVQCFIAHHTEDLNIPIHHIEQILVLIRPVNSLMKRRFLSDSEGPVSAHSSSFSIGWWKGASGVWSPLSSCIT